MVENLSLFTLIYLGLSALVGMTSWESFIIHLDILRCAGETVPGELRIFHYSPWYTYVSLADTAGSVENLSLFTLIYLRQPRGYRRQCWESFIIHLDILTTEIEQGGDLLRIFHYSPWYTYRQYDYRRAGVENLSLFTLIYLAPKALKPPASWESFIIHLDILIGGGGTSEIELRIFHYSPWYTYAGGVRVRADVENLSLFTLIYLVFGGGVR